MVVISMLPIGLMQVWASVEYGTWYARSSEFMQTPLMIRLRWMRMIGDSIFAVGALVLGWFVLGLWTGHSYDKRGEVAEGEWEVRPHPVQPARLVGGLTRKLTAPDWVPPSSPEEGGRPVIPSAREPG
jgi:hypothetical protein